MDNFEIFPSAASLPLLTQARTRSISAENPTGEPGKGGMAVPALTATQNENEISLSISFPRFLCNDGVGGGE
ncbi:MAG: hypothetical protein WCK05_08230 [Planctomycetota bacterium]